jgi:dTDP-4-dehydrorhamnose reductase
LGAHVARAAAAEGHEVSGTYWTFPVRLPGVRGIGIDLGENGAVENLLKTIKPSWVIHCAAATDVDACEADPEWAERINRDLPRRLARTAAEQGVRLAVLSTDAVFDGETGGYREADPPNPINVYGRTKWEGELATAEEHPSATIVRTNFYGRSLRGERSIAEWFLNRLEAGLNCPGFVDIRFNPLVVTDLADLLLELLATDQVGLIHVAGRSCVTKYEFGRELAGRFGHPVTLIEPSESTSAALTARRPKKLCLDVGRIESLLQRRMPDLAQGLERFAREERLAEERPAGRGARA